jgi:hypothetical protein
MQRVCILKYKHYCNKVVYASGQKNFFAFD